MEKKPSPQRRRGGYLEALLDSSPHAIIAINAEGVITFANKEAYKLGEREMHELVGSSITTIYENLEAARETNRKLYMNNGVIHDHESKFKTKTGKLVPVRISASHLRDSAGNYIGAVGFFERYRPWSAAEIQVKTRAEELETELEALKGLSAPVFQLYSGLSMLVICEQLDVSRFARVTGNLLSHIKSVKAQVLLIDLSAAFINDAAPIASELLKLIRTLQLLGTQCVLTGLQPPLAQALEVLMPDVSAVKTFCSTDISLEAAFGIIGLEICKKDQK